MNNVTYKPKTDILQRETSLEMLLDVPGVRKEDLKIQVEKRKLIISGKVRPTELKAVRAEYPVGNYERAFVVGEDFKTESIEASLENGVLRLKLPKNETALPVEIKVN